MTSGPPTAAPNWWRSSGGFGSLIRLPRLRDLAHEEVAGVERVVAQVFEDGAVEQRCCPDLVDTDTTPAPRPNSAEKTPVSTLNSRTCSTDGAMITVLNVYSLLSMPSISQPLALAWWPSALKFDAPRGLKVLAPERFSPAWPGVTPGVEVDERREVAAVQRQLLDGALLDDRADLRRVGPEQRRFGDDRRRFLDAADLERHVDARALVDLEDDPFPPPLPEALHVHFDGVGARREERSGIVPVSSVT